MQTLPDQRKIDERLGKISTPGGKISSSKMRTPSAQILSKNQYIHSSAINLKNRANLGDVHNIGAEGDEIHQGISPRQLEDIETDYRDS